MVNFRLQDSLWCLDCKGGLQDCGSHLLCFRCKKRYVVEKETIFFTAPERSIRLNNKNTSDISLVKFKHYLKKYPRLFSFLYRLTTPLVGKSSKEFIRDLPLDALAINLGSGVMTVDPRVIDVDREPYPNVRVAADASHLPFKDASVDAVIAESLLEHTPNPHNVAAEIKRVLKPQGLVYILVPFMLGFHSAPNDYYRWTISGLRELFSDFKEEDSGIGSGVTLALTRLWGEWLANLLSFGSRTSYQLWLLVFTLVFIPVNFLDLFLLRSNFSANAAMSIYFIGRKIS